jgi:uncharacterized DUF497 family protein
VSFEEAATVFFDENAIELFDPEHSADEDRFLMLGRSYRLRVLVVAYCVRMKGSQIKDYLRKEGNRQRAKSIYRKKTMKQEYDFSKMRGRKNPYAGKLKKQVTLRLGVDVIAYFKKLAKTVGAPYQNLINLYLSECVRSHKKLSLRWAS